MYFTSDPVADAERYIREQEKNNERLPECECCGERIVTDYAYKIFDCWVCEDCVINARREVPYTD